MSYRLTSLASLILACALLQGCAIPRHTLGKSVEHGNVALDFISARMAPEFTTSTGRVVRTNDTFVIVEVQMLNKSREPLSYMGQPAFKLEDTSGAVYDFHSLNSALLNAGRQGASSTSLNPNMKVTKAYVFEVPRGRTYAMQVLVPQQRWIGSTSFPVRPTRPDFYIDIPAAPVVQ
jgi:hypothetical protein